MTRSSPNGYYDKTTFDNGLRVLTSTMPHTRSVAICIYVGAGSRYEVPEHSGVSHFIEHMCFKGTEKRPTAAEISEAIDGVGGVLNAATDREFTVYYAKVPQQHLSLAVDVLVDLVRAPVLDPVELEKERKVVLEEIASVADSPAQQVDLLLDRMLWPDQPLGWDIAGNNESVEGLTRDITLDYMARQYVPCNTVVTAAGNVTADEMASMLGPTLGQTKSGEPGPWSAAREDQSEPACEVLYKRTEQSHIAIGMRGLRMGHPDRYAMDLLSILLGEGMSSRLFLELRERQGLCYDVHSYVSHYQDTGAFGVYAAVDPSNARKAVGALVGELAKLTDGVPEEELRKAKELSKGRMLLRMEDTRAVSGFLGGQELLMGRVKSPDEVVAHVEAVTTDQVRGVAREVIRKENLNLAIVGPHRSAQRFLAALRI